MPAEPRLWGEPTNCFQMGSPVPALLLNSERLLPSVGNVFLNVEVEQLFNTSMLSKSQIFIFFCQQLLVPQYRSSTGGERLSYTPLYLEASCQCKLLPPALYRQPFREVGVEAGRTETNLPVPNLQNMSRNQSNYLVWMFGSQFTPCCEVKGSLLPEQSNFGAKEKPDLILINPFRLCRWQDCF